MRATEIIRGVLDLIDQVEQDEEPPQPIAITAKAEIEPGNPLDDNMRRFKQIIDLVSNDKNPAEFSNAPDETVADIDAVTVNAGGGWNGPKHPADIKGEHPSLYPGKVYGVR